MSTTPVGPDRKTRISFGEGTYASKTGLRIAPGAMATYDEWAAVGRKLAMFADASVWWRADWATYGTEQSYGDRYEEAIETLGLEYGTIANYRYVADRFEYSRRRENLSFGHHFEVASLTPDEADEWLDRAETDGWSRERLREELRAARAPAALPAPDPAGVVLEQVRLTWPVERIERWKAKAGEAGLSYTDWVGKTCDEAAA